MFDSYTERALRVIVEARIVVSRFGGSAITPEHLLLGILRRSPEVITSVHPEPIDVDQLIDLLEKSVRAGQRVRHRDDVPVSIALKEVFSCAAEEAKRLGHRHVAVGHLVLGILLTDGPVRRLLEERGVSPEAVRQRLGTGERIVESVVPYTRGVIRIMGMALKQAIKLGSSVMTPQHVMLAILRSGRESLGRFPADADAIGRLVESVEASLPTGPQSPTPVEITHSQSLEEILQYADEEKLQLGQRYTAIGHLVLGMLRSNDPTKDLLVKLGVSMDEVRTRLREATADDEPVALGYGFSLE